MVEHSGDVKTVEMKAICDEHTCNRVRILHHRQARSSLIGSAIQGRVQVHSKYRPVEIVHDAHREQGIKISYSTTWRAKEDAVANINGSHVDAYAQLPNIVRILSSPTLAALSSLTSLTTIAFCACLSAMQCLQVVSPIVVLSSVSMECI